MMGSSDTPQKPFFYAFNLDDMVPQDHLLRSIDRFLDLSDLRQHLAPYYSHTKNSKNTQEHERKNTKGKNTDIHDFSKEFSRRTRTSMTSPRKEHGHP